MGTEGPTNRVRQRSRGPQRLRERTAIRAVRYWLVVVLLALALGPAVAMPPRPSSGENGLTENESATLWSGDDDSRYISNAAYERAYGEPRTAIHEIANATDWTFTEPPDTAERWTRADHLEFPVGDETVSYAPPGAGLGDSGFIADAHVSVFSVSPATWAHQTPDPDGSVFYIAPSGEVYGVIDYRLRTPESAEDPTEQSGRQNASEVAVEATQGSNDRIGSPTDDRITVRWEVLEHGIEEVRLLRDGEVLDRSDGTHRPVLTYTDLNGSAVTFTIEADVYARIERTTITERRTNVTALNGTVSFRTVAERETETLEDRITVSDTVSGTVYDLRAGVSYATYPDGTVGVAVFQSAPWQGYTLTTDESVHVRGVWRFYTARDPRWDELVRSGPNGTERVVSPALPVSVHAYPSTLGPRAEPVGRGIELLTVWGIEQTSPRESLDDRLLIDVIDGPYETSYGLAVRTQHIDRDAVRVHGIVRGVEVTPSAAVGAGATNREIRESTLTATVLERDATGITVELRLVDGETGAPIWLGAVDDPRYAPIVASDRAGYISIAGETVETNDAGVATVRLTRPGVYTARYHPGSWLSHDPAYMPSSATVRWHPLSTAEAWLSFAVEVLVALLPLGLALYVGRRLGDMLRYRYGGDSA